MFRNSLLSFLLNYGIFSISFCLIISTSGISKVLNDPIDIHHSLTSDKDILIDEGITAENSVPSCTPPSSLNANTVSCQSAFISWIEGEEAISYDLRFRLANTLDWTDVSNLDGSSFLLENLNELSTYEWQMRASCPDSLSNWINGENFDTFGGVEETVIEASNDSYVDSSNPDQNFSQESSLRVLQSAQTNQQLITYLEFNVDGIDDKGIEAVKLKLDGVVGNNAVNIDMGVFLTSNNWTEEQITFNNAPPAEGEAIGTFSGTLPPSGILEIELDLAAFPSDGNYFLILSPSGNMDELILFTSESANEPELVFEDAFSCLPCEVPTSLAVNSVTDTSADFSWQGGDPAISYDVRFRLSENQDWGDVINTTEEELTVDTLVEGATYNWQVRSVCEDETTEFVDGPNFTTTLGCGVPEALIVDSLSFNSATVSWQASGEVLNYDLQFRKLGDANFTTVNDLTNTFFTLSGLDPLTTYEWQVRSSCEGLDTEYTIGTNFTTTQDSSCNPPIPLPVEVTSPDSVLLQWEPVLSAVSYTVRYRPEGEEGFIDIFDIPTTNVLLSDLEPLTVYEWEVASICENDTSDYEIGANFASSSEEPCDAPTNPVVDSVVLTTVSLSWQEAQQADRYELRYRVAGTEPFTFLDSIVPSSIELTDLESITTYEWEVRSACDAAASEWVQGPEFTTGISTSLKELKALDVQVYPNPSSESFTIKVLNSEELFISVNVRNALGQLIYSNEKQSVNESISIGKDWSAGIYMIVLTNETQGGTFKVIKTE